MKEVVQFYGVEVGRSNKACCPFQPDNDPSLHIYADHYYCFGCGAHGDVTDFVARLFELTQIKAAKKLDYDLGLHLTDRNFAPVIRHRINPEAEYRRWLINADKALNTYLNKLCQWRKKYAPKKPDEELHPLFVESLSQMDYTEYLYDMVKFGSESEQRAVYEENRKAVDQIIERVKQHDIPKPAAAREKSIAASSSAHIVVHRECSARHTV